MSPPNFGAGARLHRSLVTACALLLAHALLLRWLGLHWGDQLTLTLVAATWTLAGLAVVLRGLEPGLLEDRLGRLLLACLAGSALHAGLCFAAFHEPVRRVLGVRDVRAAAGLAFLVLLPLAFAGVRELVSRRGLDGTPAEAGPSLVVFALASLVAITTAYGFHNNEEDKEGHVRQWVAAGRRVLEQPHPPSWGATQDRYFHLMGGQLHRQGFPAGFPKKESSHRGVETLLVGLGQLSGGFSAQRWAALSKPLCLLWLFAVAYWSRLLALGLGCGRRAALLAAAGALFYAALNPWLARELLTSYRVAPASGTLYHSVTQQASLAVGLGGLLIALGRIEAPGRGFVLGCALLGASFFFKPSLFSVALPPLLLVALCAGRRGLRAALLGGALASACAAAWLLYPSLFGIRRFSVSTSLGFLPWHALDTPYFVGWAGNGPLALLVTVLLFSYAGLALPVFGAVRRFARGARAGIAPALRGLPRAGVVLALVFVGGTLSGFFLTQEGPKAEHGNFMWGSAAGLLCALPLVVRGIERLEPVWLRGLAWALYLAQLASGAWNLVVFTWRGAI